MTEGAVRAVADALAAIHYPMPVPAAPLRAGDPTCLLPLLQYSLVEFSPYVAARLLTTVPLTSARAGGSAGAASPSPLSQLDDYEFTRVALRGGRELLLQRPSLLAALPPPPPALQPEQFLSRPGAFVGAKLATTAWLLRGAAAIHAVDAAEAARLAPRRLRSTPSQRGTGAGAAASAARAPVVAGLGGAVHEAKPAAAAQTSPMGVASPLAALRPAQPPPPPPPPSSRLPHAAAAVAASAATVTPVEIGSHVAAEQAGSSGVGRGDAGLLALLREHCRQTDAVVTRALNRRRGAAFEARV